MIKKTSLYFKSVQSEISKVTWLSKNEMLGSTLIVGVFSVIVALYLFVADFSFTRLMSLLIG
tara:strand:- start:333 stop:518 length:186 start_codon:yes stop_codon:yes gene_type:complete